MNVGRVPSSRIQRSPAGEYPRDVRQPSHERFENVQSLLLDEPPDKEQDRFSGSRPSSVRAAAIQVPSGLRERLGIDAVRNDPWLSPKATISSK